MRISRVECESRPNDRSMIMIYTFSQLKGRNYKVMVPCPPSPLIDHPALPDAVINRTHSVGRGIILNRHVREVSTKHTIITRYLVLEI